MSRRVSNRITKKCEGCGSTFDVLPSRIHIKYCSKECRNKARSVKRTKYINKICLICDIEYGVTQSRSESKYCSAKCRTKATSLSNRGRTFKRTISIILNCQICNKEMKVKQSEIKRGVGKYCSSECKYKSFSLSAEKKRTLIECVVCKNEFSVPNSLKQKRFTCSVKCRAVAQQNATFHPCPNCGKEVKQIPSRKNNNRSIYCSTSCRTIYTKTGVPRPDASERMSGKNNPMYGKAPIHPEPIFYVDMFGRELLLRSTFEYRFIKVLEFANLFFCYEPLRFKMDKKTYVPDFYIPALGGFIEVKGWVRDEHYKLMDEFSEKYGHIELVNEDKLILAENNFGLFIKSLSGGFCKSSVEAID